MSITLLTKTYTHQKSAKTFAEVTFYLCASDVKSTPLVITYNLYKYTEKQPLRVYATKDFLSTETITHYQNEFKKECAEWLKQQNLF